MSKRLEAPVRERRASATPQLAAPLRSAAVRGGARTGTRGGGNFKPY